MFAKKMGFKMSMFVMLFSIIPQLSLAINSSTLKFYDDQREKELIRIQEIANRIVEASPKREVVKEAIDVFLKLKELSSATEMGINYKDYQDFLRETKSSVDRFEFMNRYEDDFNLIFKITFNNYIDANNSWKEKINPSGWTRQDDEMELRIKQKWKTGTEAVGIIESMFRKL